MNDEKLKKALEDYLDHFGNLNIYGPEFPDVTLEMLKNAVKNNKEIQPEDEDGVFY